jgi:hypothetical protein
MIPLLKDIKDIEHVTKIIKRWEKEEKLTSEGSKYFKSTNETNNINNIQMTSEQYVHQWKEALQIQHDKILQHPITSQDNSSENSPMQMNHPIPPPNSQNISQFHSQQDLSILGSNNNNNNNNNNANNNISEWEEYLWNTSSTIGSSSSAAVTSHQSQSHPQLTIMTGGNESKQIMDEIQFAHQQHILSCMEMFLFQLLEYQMKHAANSSSSFSHNSNNNNNNNNHATNTTYHTMDQVTWKLIFFSAYNLLYHYHHIAHLFSIVEDDYYSLCCAAIFLASKIEHCLIKVERLQTILASPTCQRLVVEYFGSRSLTTLNFNNNNNQKQQQQQQQQQSKQINHYSIQAIVPLDIDIFHYERLLLQSISYNMNKIKNPLRVSFIIIIIIIIYYYLCIMYL